MRILWLTKYGHKGPSSRYRFLQYLPEFQRGGHQVEVAPLFTNQYVAQLFAGKRTGHFYLFLRTCRRIWTCLVASKFEMVWIEGELIPYSPPWFERLLIRFLPKKRFYDFDDAIWHRYPTERQIKFEITLKDASAIVVGNQYLAQFVEAFNPRVSIIPTTIDWDRYREVHVSGDRQIIGWIGTPNTLFYLQELAPALLILRKRIDFELRIVGAQWQYEGLNVSSRPWSLAGEIDELSQFGIGIMPLRDDPWSRGKCGLKLIQYFACGIPAVASPVGVNVPYVRLSEGGRLASTHDDWVEQLFELLSNPELRIEMGKRARTWVEANATISSQTSKLMAALDLNND